MITGKSILIFGCGELQQSIIRRAHKMGLYVVGIDPCANAYSKDDVDSFEIVGGNDFDGTCAVVEKYCVEAIVTAATDKPLVMMARIAEKYGFPFISVETAHWSTDKFLMKKQFEYGEIPHAQGRLISRIEELEGLSFPVIVKPRDNSGSRGVKYCRNRDELISSIAEALEFSRLDSVLVEEYIEGQEYSVESLHYNGKSEVIQFTEKKTTAFPYNVELGHKQPANLTYEQKKAILRIVQKIGEMLKFDNCPSHTELKINERGIFVIETSPRLGGDSITSTLVPLSTGINMEDLLINIAFFEPVDFFSSRTEGSSAIEFFQFKEGVVKYINPKIYGLAKESGVYSFNLKLKEGDLINKITSSLNRYGEFVVAASSRPKVEEIISLISERVNQYIAIE